MSSKSPQNIGQRSEIELRTVGIELEGRRGCGKIFDLHDGILEILLHPSRARLPVRLNQERLRRTSHLFSLFIKSYFKNQGQTDQWTDETNNRRTQSLANARASLLGGTVFQSMERKFRLRT